MGRSIENTFTAGGRLLIARSLAEGKPVVFTGAEIGTGVAPDADDISTYTALISKYDDADIPTRKVDNGGNLIITASYWNTTVLTSVYIDEIGVFAKLEGDSDPVLFSYLTFGDYPDLILAVSDASVQRTYDLPYAFGSGTAASVIIEPSGLLPASDAVDEAEAGKLLRLNAQGKLDADITGDAYTLGGHTYDWFAPATHVHAVATASADGFMSSGDKSNHDLLVSRVNQSVTTASAPIFSGLTVNGYIDGAMFR